MNELKLEGRLHLEEAETGAYVKIEMEDGSDDYLDELLDEAFGPGDDFGQVVLTVVKQD